MGMHCGRPGDEAAWLGLVELMDFFVQVMTS